MATLQILFGLKLLNRKRGALSRCYYSCIFISCLPRPGLGDYEKPPVHACVRVRLSHFYINLYISAIYEDIFTKFEETIYGYENMFVKSCVIILKKQHGRHGGLFENY